MPSPTVGTLEAALGTSRPYVTITLRDMSGETRACRVEAPAGITVDPTVTFAAASSAAASLAAALANESAATLVRIEFGYGVVLPISDQSAALPTQYAISSTVANLTVQPLSGQAGVSDDPISIALPAPIATRIFGSATQDVVAVSAVIGVNGAFVFVPPGAQAILSEYQDFARAAAGNGTLRVNAMRGVRGDRSRRFSAPRYPVVQ